MKDNRCTQCGILIAFITAIAFYGLIALFIHDLRAQEVQIAFFTGERKPVTLTSGGRGVACQYDYNGRMIWQTFAGSRCPRTIEVK